MLSPPSREGLLPCEVLLPQGAEGLAMVPGQSKGDLSQQSQTMKAGEDEESSRGSRRSSHRHLHELPAATGKVAGAECQLFIWQQSSIVPVELMLGAVKAALQSQGASQGMGLWMSDSEREKT